MAVLEISVLPVGTSSPSISSYITDICTQINEEGLTYTVTPTSTVIEGDTDNLMDLAKKLHKAPFQRGVDRVITNISIDERKDKELEIEKLIDTVKLDMTRTKNKYNLEC